MEKESQLGNENLKLNERVFISKNILEMYVDLTVRGLIAFLTLGLFSYFVLIRWLNLKIYWTLPIIFVGSIFISPFLSKIKLGHRVQEKYDNFLRKVIFHIRK
jgi:hypothetical protein